MPKIIFHPRAEKRLARLPKQDQHKVIKAACQMQSSPFESLNVQKYQTAAGKFYRIRLGDIRIIFEFDPKTNNQ